MMRYLSRVLVAGTAGAVGSAVTLAVAAGFEGRAPAQPINATSHWWYGTGAARIRQVDAAHTGIGFATHLAATILWASLFEYWASRRPGRTSAEVTLGACATAALAAVVDYTITPKRWTPGWEFVLSRRAMAAGYAAMAGGFLLARIRPSAPQSRSDSNGEPQASVRRRA